jgi:hypothetical protein
VPKACSRLKAMAPPPRVGEASGAPGGVFDGGTYEEDGPVTWETPISPQETPAQRGAGHHPRTRRAPADGARAVAGPTAPQRTSRPP